MRVIAIANDGVQKRAEDSHSAFNEEKRFEPEGGAVAKNAAEEKLRRDFGPVFLAALNDPQTIEILLNADGTLWQEKLGGRMEPIGQMSATRAEAVLRTIAACLNTVITWDHPILEAELPLDSFRFSVQLPPVVS